MSKLFGKKQTPEELCKKWRLELRKQERELDRSIREITQAENKLKMEIRKYAKAGDTVNAKTLARELVTSRHAKERLYTQKAQLNSVALQLQQQSSMIRVTGCMQKSVEVMTLMNSLMRVPQMNAVMMAMSREMEKAGLMEEMMDDALGEMDGEEELDDAAEEEVDKALDDILAGVRGPSVRAPQGRQQVAVDEEEEEEEDVETQKRLAALKA